MMKGAVRICAVCTATIGLACFLVGGGFVLGRRIATDEKPEGRLAHLPVDEARRQRDICQAARDERKYPSVVRANAHAAATMVQLRGESAFAGPIVFGARVRGDNDKYRLFVQAEEPGPHAVAVVVMFGDDKGRLVQCGYRLAEPCRPAEFYFISDRVKVSPESLAAKGIVGADGIVRVEIMESKNDQGIPIPDGDVALGLQYADGSYSNFIQLEFRKPPESTRPSAESESGLPMPEPGK